MTTALVLSAGGMFGAWEVGVWKTLGRRLQPDCFLGASAGAWNSWVIAAGGGVEELAAAWLDPSTAAVMSRASAMHEKARDLFARFRPQAPFGLTLVAVPRFRQCLVRDSAVTWQHLAATCSIPLVFPPVRIEGVSYVDGGLLGALPLWAAQEMGATRAVAVNALGGPGLPLSLRALRAFRELAVPRPRADLEVLLVEPSTPLGSMRDAMRWSRANVERWIEQGERDANCACTSITM